MSGEGRKTMKARIGTILAQPKLKRGLVFLIFFCVLVAVTDWFVLQHLNRSSLRERDAYSEQLSAIEAHIRKHGITPELNRIMAAIPPSMRFHRFYGVFVQEKPRTIPIVDQHGNVVLQEVQEETEGPKILAAYPQEWIGKLAKDVYPKYPSSWYARKTKMGTGMGAEVTAPDGRKYDVTLLLLENRLPFWAAERVFLLAVVLVWVSLAAWIYVDAHSRVKPAAPAWLLLGLLTGPFALAVWLIIRPSPAANAVCPGCGADAPKDALFCVRCGYALRAACPECRRAVGQDWHYCASCGAHLSDDPL